MPKSSRRKRLTRPPKWTRRQKPKEFVTNTGTVSAEVAPFSVPVVPVPVVPVAAFPLPLDVEEACPIEPETLPQPQNLPVPVPLGQEDFPAGDGDNDIPLLRNTDDLIQCLKDHLKKWKEP